MKKYLVDYRLKFTYCEPFEGLLFEDFGVLGQLHEGYCVLIALFAAILSVMPNKERFTYFKEN